MSSNPPQQPTNPQPGPNPQYPANPQQFPGNGQQPYGGMPAGAPPAQKKNWFARHKVLTGIGIVVLLIIIIGAIGGGGSKGGDSDTSKPAAGSTTSQADATSGAQTTKAAPSTKAATQAAAMPKVGDTAKDGKTDFTLQAWECGLSHVGPDGFGKDAQGQYCLATLQVKNNDNKAITWMDSNQKLMDNAGATYKSSSDGIYIDGYQILEDVNPGNTLTVKVLYDVPKDGFQPKSLELHESAFSKGVKFDLAG